MLDLLAPEVVSDPHATLRELRERDPVHWSERHRLWILTRYTDVLAAFKDLSLSSEHQGTGDLSDPIQRVLRNWMEFRDPPDHARLRRLVQKAFTPRVVERLRPRIESLVDGMLEEIAARGGGDYMADFAYPLPATVIAEMLGVPTADQVEFRGWSEDIKGVVFGAPNTEHRSSRAHSGFLAMEKYFRELVALYRSRPAENLISAMIAAEEGGDYLDEREILGTSVLLLFGGHETTSNLLSNGLLALDAFPDQRHKLEADPHLIPQAVEEFLRWEGPTMGMLRLCREDFELRGRKIRAGQRLLLHQTAADRDPEQFENPDVVAIERENLNSHLAFGFGRHYCLGAPLARLEGQIAFDRIIRRFPGLRIEPGPREWQPTLLARNLARLPVRFAATGTGTGTGNE